MQINKNIAFDILFFGIGSAGCFLLQSNAGLSSVVSSSVIGLAGSFIPESTIFEKQSSRAAVYSGSFAGMCSSSILSSLPMALLLGVLGGLVFFVSRRFFDGFGGKLGTIAFISVAFLMVLGRLL